MESKLGWSQLPGAEVELISISLWPVSLGVKKSLTQLTLGFLALGIAFEDQTLRQETERLLTLEEQGSIFLGALGSHWEC